MCHGQVTWVEKSRWTAEHLPIWIDNPHELTNHFMEMSWDVQPAIFLRLCPKMKKHVRPSDGNVNVTNDDIMCCCFCVCGCVKKAKRCMQSLQNQVSKSQRSLDWHRKPFEKEDIPSQKL